MKITLSELLKLVHIDGPVRVRIPDGDGINYTFNKLLSEFDPADRTIYTHTVKYIYTHLGDGIEIAIDLEANP